VKPDTFAAVMATGIVSIAAVDHGYGVISDVLIVLAAVALSVLIVAAAAVWRRESWKLTDLDVALRLCTYIAACAVVGARLAEHRIVLWVLAGMALQGWLSLAPVVARRMWRDRGGLRGRAHGGWELASVATSGLAIVMADLRIVFWALVLWALAIAVYLVMTGLIVWRAVHDPSAPMLVQPDIWILMGGAAIAT
jgi:Voltage-dependent anion channel